MREKTPASSRKRTHTHIKEAAHLDSKHNYLYPLSTSVPPLLLALLARGSIGLVISSLPSVSSTSAASLSSARSDSKVTRATANCSSRPLHFLPGISTPQVCNSSAGCNENKNKTTKQKCFSDPQPRGPLRSGVKAAGGKGEKKGEEKNYKNKAKELGKDADESVGDAVHRRKTNKKRVTFFSSTVNAEK